jgi:sugar/nucleoside kinase (ribokinase family)
VSSFFLQRALVPGLGELLARARERGATTSLDPNWDPSGTWDGGLRELLGELDVLLPNAAEAVRLTGEPDPARAAAVLAASGPLVAVKLGAAGALAVRPGAGRAGRWLRGEPVHVAAPAVSPRVDTIGAGDSFDAGFLAGWLERRELAGALALGCACGAHSTRAVGGTAAQPTLAEALAFVEAAA